MDDQENFWDALFDSRRKKRSAKDYVACFRHCDNNESCSGIEESQVGLAQQFAKTLEGF
jgi:phenylpropionate dioxygenase-like ring-hydroxylating dioxygenase large terminal subunit